MINEKAQLYRQEIIKLRKKLADLETKRSKGGVESESEILQTFVNISLELDRYEQALIRINQDAIKEINRLTEQISIQLKDYNHWSKKMREMEKLFSVNILRPGYILKQAVRQRKFLEEAHNKIRRGIIEYRYTSMEEVEVEIRNVLMHGDNAFDANERSYEDEKIKEANMWEVAENVDPTSMVEKVDEDQIVQDFKRIVLPAVHPDTSDAPKETFLTVWAAYKAQDVLLMEAYVACYRGKLEIDDKEDLLTQHERLMRDQQQYYKLSERLKRRMDALKSELTPEELEDNEKIEKHLKKQGQEIRKLIQSESEKIIKFREKIEGLIEFYTHIKKERNE